MKKLFALLCVLCLTTVSCAFARGSFTASCGGVSLYTLSYDSGVYSLDRDSYLGTSHGNHTWLGMFYNTSCSIDCAADVYGDLALSGSGNQALSQLSTYLVSRLAHEKCAYLGNYGAFALFSLNNGQRYYAAAAINGYVVSFEIYNMLCAADSAALGTLKSFLNGVSF